MKETKTTVKNVKPKERNARPILANAAKVKDPRLPKTTAIVAMPVDPVKAMIAQIEGEVYNGSAYALQKLDGWCMKRGLDGEAIISPERQAELLATTVRMAKRIRELEAIMAGLPAAVDEAKALNGAEPVMALLARMKITEGEKKSSKVKKMLAAAEQALNGLNLRSQEMERLERLEKEAVRV